MSGANAPGKTSSDSGQHAALDRWSQRRLQRLNTEQGFREQRQGGGQNALGPSQSNDTSTGYNSNVNTQYPPSDAQGVSHVYSPHPSHQSTFSTSRSSSANQQPSGLAIQPQSNMNSSRSPGNQSHDSPNPYAQPHYQQSPRDSTSHQDSSRPNITQSRSISYQGANSDDSQSAGNNGNMTASKQGRSTNSNANSNSNRQSVHNGMTRDNSQPGVPTYNYSSNNQGHSQQKADVGRATPQPLQIGGEDMNPEDVVQLIKDHRELRKSHTAPSPHVVFMFANLYSLQVRNTPKSRSITLKKKIKSNSYRTAWLINGCRSRAHLWMIASIPHVSIAWMV